MTKRILLSTDIGSDIDDALALNLALNHPDIDLIGIYTTNGDMPIRAKIARRMTELAGHNAVVAMGEGKALEGSPPSYSTGLEKVCVVKEYKGKTPQELGIVEDGISDLVERVEEGNITIASIAPLTNIARLLERDPQAHKRVNALYVMGGRFKLPEHNFRHDVKAAQKVLDSDLSIIVVPADVCNRYRRPFSDLQAMGSSCGKYVKEMMDKWLAFSTWREYGNTGIVSACARMMQQDPEFPRYMRYFIEGLNDSNFVISHPEEYLRTRAIFIDILRARTDHKASGEILKKVEEATPQDAAIHDTYVIYSIVHPERVQTRDVKIEVGSQGEMSLSKGKKHKLVIDIDFDHFQDFLGKYLK